MNQKYLKQLVEKARPFTDIIQCRQKHVTLILDGKRIVSLGVNDSIKTHPLSAKFGYRFNNIHSELAAILHCQYKPSELKYFTFVNIRYMKDGSVGLARPCRHCMRLFDSFSVSDVWYSNYLGQFEKL